jgi:hypothetical protein
MAKPGLADLDRWDALTDFDRDMAPRSGNNFCFGKSETFH